MIRFELPSLGADMEEGTLLQWHVKPGDTVKRGQVVAVVDTSKAAVDVEIWQDGVVAELLVQPGEKVPVGTVLATLLAPGETATPATAVRPEPVEGLRTAEVPQGLRPLRRRSGQAAQPEREPGMKPGSPTGGVTRAAISPAARKRAQELGVDPATVHGTGSQGSVTLADIEAAAAARAVPSPAAVAQDRQKEMRRAIAAAMSRSKREIPHYYLSETIPMAAALAWLQQRNAGLPITERILPAVLQLKAVAMALRRVPQLNGFYRDGAYQAASAVHTGVAISLRGGGLLAPAIHDVGSKPLAQLMRELADLVFGVIYPPQVALVGFGGVAVRPWVQDGELRALPVVTATLAADHRVTDGHQGALFLAELRELLQQPQMLAADPGAAATQQGSST
jgi:pyruvate dehydrogenase E2 component (dihydrolipoamide acetyltransferase)